MDTKPTAALPIADVPPPELKADTQAVIEKRMTGKPLDPEQIAADAATFRPNSPSSYRSHRCRRADRWFSHL